MSAHALRHGLTTGVLLATADGRHLYRNLGWTQHATLAAAFVPPLTAASAPPAATPAVPPTATPAVPPTAATPSAAVPAAP